ncbi:HIT family protein [Paenibacillus oleatilyticus]|uniref:HIT family protein n=1 Tax=Paenibacillus oleatilyticus TaxID=2594886 RepID=A0ABV4V6B9_9BACL
MKCAICNLHETNIPEIVDVAKFWVVRLNPSSSVQGYRIIEPKRHVENWNELSNDEFAEMGDLIKKLEINLKEMYNAERVYVVTISEQVRHLHLHVIPRAEDSALKGLPLINNAIL